MNFPACYNVDSAMKDYYPTLAQSSYGTCELLSPHSVGVNGGYDDPSYLPQWSDGIDSYGPTYPSANEDLYGSL